MATRPTVRRPLRKAAVVLALCVWAEAACAQDAGPIVLPDPSQDVPLGEAELLAAFTDRTHRGTYTFKRPKIETFAFEERTTADGRTVHRHGDKTDRGTWRVRANVICFDYEDWDARGGRHLACFNIFKQGNCFYHYGLRLGQPGMGGFTARTVHKGDEPDCEPPIA